MSVSNVTSKDMQPLKKQIAVSKSPIRHVYDTNETVKPLSAFTHFNISPEMGKISIDTNV